ncbi:TonB-dependent receptor [Pseudomaricurvus alkylphenolicus]|uniref:TonB-dependent receptor n=1 Tax=Pseudomaricurvus alkylphenolicus TaxID=1306991 RepID=UPI001422EC72|nr:TonB-dependent receptor [Pseudomaricurvus alkylphenolicus]NIB45108.1 TonB-dependent receptor [Pseudomaricurvus alkylphenolicus]
MLQKTKIALGISYAITALGAGFAHAADTNSAESEDFSLEEIVVTASKRGYAQSLQDISTSIQAVTQDAIEASGITDLSSVGQLAPSLNIVDVNGNGSPQISMRGITAGSFKGDSVQDQALTSVYLDDMALSAPGFTPNIELFDIQRVEVLRGPQGTLYGNGAMGGNVRFVTNKANFEEFAAKIEAGVSSIDEGGNGYSTKGMVNLPLSDTLALRVVATHQEDPSYIDNITLDNDDDNELSRSNLRTSLRYAPTDDLEITGNIFYQEQELGESGNGISYEDDGSSVIKVRDLTTAHFGETLQDNEMVVYSLNVEYQTDWVNLVSTTSFLDREYSTESNTYDVLVAFVGVQAEDSPIVHEFAQEDFSQEIRVSSANTESDLQWVVGGYYSKQKLQYDIEYLVPGFTDIVEATYGVPIELAFGAPTTAFGVGGNGPLDDLFFGDTSNEQEHLGFFGELTYRLTDKLEVLAGWRWSDWEQDYSQHYAGLFNGGETLNTGDDSFEKTTYKLSVSYDLTEDAMIYASKSTGFRFGGINDQIPLTCGANDAERNFEPDNITNLEIGAKTSWLDNRISANVTAYQSEWKNVQSQVALTHCGFAYKNNQGEQESKGVEFEITALPMRDLMLSLAGAYMEAEFVKGNTASGAEKGDTAPYVPELSLSASGEYTFPVNQELEGFVRLSYQYTGERSADYNLARTIQLQSYEIVNLRTGVRANDWTVTAFANNLLNEQEPVTGGLAFGKLSAVVSKPRTVGLTFSREF